VCECSEGIQELETGQNIYQLSSWYKFCSLVFLSLTLDFYTSEDIINLVGMPVGNTRKCSIYCKFGATDLIRFRFPKSSIQHMGFP